MSALQGVYDNSPIFFQNVMCSVSGKQKYKERYGKEYWKARRFCQSFDNWPLERQLEYQRKQLIKFIRFSVQHSSFYRELYKGIDLSQIETIEDLVKLPVVNKEMLRSNIEDVYTVQKQDALESNTGGTTGKSLTVRFTKHDFNVRMAVLDHFKSRVGFENLKMRRATFNGKHIIPPKQKAHVYWRYNAPCRQMIYSSFDLTEEKIGYYVKSLNKYKPHAIDGFFTSICDVASYIERHNIELKFTPIAIFPTSETLNDVGRQLIERVFKCKVYDQYASSEGAPFITECINQTLHMELNTGVFEVTDTGEILVTSFTTHGTPLIRYAIGDAVELPDAGTTCSCGLHGSVVKKIHGRRLDFLYRTDGAKINAGNVSNILKYLPNAVIRAQFIQDAINHVTILLEIDKDSFTEESKNEILKECEHTLGTDMNVDIRIIKEIPRAASGKFRMIINKVQLEQV